MSTVFKSKTGETLARHFIGVGHGGSDPGASGYAGIYGHDIQAVKIKIVKAA